MNKCRDVVEALPSVPTIFVCELVAGHSPYNPYSDLLVSTCICRNFQYSDIPCGHAIAALDIPQSSWWPASRCTIVSYSLTLEAFRLIGVQGLERQGANDCQVPLFKKAPGRPQTARLAAVSREPGSLHGGGLYKISVAGYSTRTSMCSAAQPFRLASTSDLLREGPASLSGEQRRERW